MQRCGGVFRILAIAILAIGVSGCVTMRPPVATEHAYGATIAFESLDGVPGEASARLLGALTEEAEARRLVVVPRTGRPGYRLRGYVSPHPDTRAIAWAWDIYDGNRLRVARVTGVEPVPGSWFDEALMLRVARSSLEHVTAAIAANRAPATQAAASAESPAPERRSLFATYDDFLPEAAGIVRIFSPAAAEPPPVETQPVEIPLPRQRPSPGATLNTVALAGG